MGGSGGSKGSKAASSGNYSAPSINRLRSSITEDTTIDDESRAELLKNLTDKTRQGGTGAFVRGNDFRALSADVDKAKEGTDPLYATRRLFQNRRQSVLAQPGRSQTVLTR